MHAFTSPLKELRSLVNEWEAILIKLPAQTISKRRNSQKRNIKQILGHMVDSASNNTHRIIHLQYQTSPLIFPDYANLGNNDKWIAIQNYENEDWESLVQVWKYTNLHICHVIENVNETKLENKWISATKEEISLKEMILGYLPHFKLHISEIEELIN
jgi:hypothetical protein